MPIRITGLNSGLDTESIISALVSSYSYKTDKYKKAQTKLSWKQDAWTELNSKIYSLYKNVGNMKLSSTYNMKTATVSNSTKVSITAGAEAANGSYSVQVTKLATSDYTTGAKLSEDITSSTKISDITNATTLKLTVGGEPKEIQITEETTIQSLMSELRTKAGVNANFDAKNGRIFISSKQTGETNRIVFDETDADSKAIWDALGLTESKGAVHNVGSDAEIWVNGAKYASDNNTFSVNGMTITATGITTTATDTNNDGQVTYDELSVNDAVSVQVNTDVQGIYDKIKDFLSQYNSIINEMTALYNADSAKGYEPLTSEEKDAMSDSEVEKWEEKIKASLLRRDDTLSGLISSMKDTMSKGIEIGEETYHLSNFGIMTLPYLDAPKNEQHAYHIDGDEDDANTSGKADKLMAMLAEDPEKVTTFMTKLATNLYDTVHKKMQSTSLSSVYTVYNDKEMASEYSDYTTTIRKWQERLEQQEDYYYKKFAAMETALSKINSQTSSLSGFFG